MTDDTKCQTKAVIWTLSSMSLLSLASFAPFIKIATLFRSRMSNLCLRLADSVARVANPDDIPANNTKLAANRGTLAGKHMFNPNFNLTTRILARYRAAIASCAGTTLACQDSYDTTLQLEITNLRQRDGKDIPK